MATPQPFFDLSALGLTVSPAQAVAGWLTSMQTAFPGYQPSTGNLEYVQAQIIASLAADLSNQCSQGANALFQNFGTQLVGVPALQGSPAVAIVTMNAVDANGYTLPGGTQVLLTLNGAPVTFQTVGTLTIPNGSTSANVTVAATVPGSAMNGAQNPAQLNSQVSWVTSVTVFTVASNGQDAESPEAYLDRLSAELTLLAPRPITESDYATLTQSFPADSSLGQEEVGRATAIDGYDPAPPSGPGWSSLAGGTGTYNNQREVTVCVTDATGNPLNNLTLTAIQAWLQAKREMNFIVNVVSANYSFVYVAATVKGSPGFDPTVVRANVQAILLSQVSPASFGLPTGSRGGNVAPWWDNQTFLYESRVQAVVQNTVGVDHVIDLAIDLNSNPTNTGDLALPGPFPLPVTNTTTIPLTAITVV